MSKDDAAKSLTEEQIAEFKEVTTVHFISDLS